MQITKCDLCKKTIKHNPIAIFAGFSPRIELCPECGLPILEFLKKQGLVKLRRQEREIFGRIRAKNKKAQSEEIAEDIQNAIKAAKSGRI